jgi:hypothetical protein
VNWLYWIYAAGVAAGLALIDARWPSRIGLALVWPIGPLAFVVTVSILLLASLVAFPVFGVIVIAVLALALLA